MRTTVSLPEAVYAAATREAAARGISRSELVTQALERHLRLLGEESPITRMDAVLELVGDDASNREAATYSRRGLSAEHW